MRCLVILALAALFSAVAQAATAQGDARTLEDRWANCSKVIHGRLGALHPESLLDQDRSDFILHGASGYFTRVTYSPCLLTSDYAEEQYLLRIEQDFGPNIDFLAASLPNIADYPTTDKLVSFSMPTTKGDMPKFTGQYVARGDAKTTATVVTQCHTNSSDKMDGRMLSINVTSTKGTGKVHYDLVFLSKEACARFPYTNKGMPPGGAAALSVVIICFVIQFGICGWYHMTHKIEVPFSTTEDEQ